MRRVSSARSSERPLRTVQVGFRCDDQQRDGETLLDAWPTLPNVAAAVARAGAEVTVVQAATARQTVQRDGVTYRFIDDTRASPRRVLGRIPMVRRPGRLLAEIAALEPDVVHVHGFEQPVAVWQLRRALPGVPVLVQDHAAHPPAGARRTAWQAMYRSLDAASFTAREQAVPFHAARVLPDTIPIFEVLEGSSIFTPGDRAQAQSAAGLSGDPCILWAGHLDANKDPLTALEAFRLAATWLPGARLWMCFGTAPLLADVQDAIERSSLLRERVTLLGRQPHHAMEQHYRASDFLMQASHREGCGYAVVEALSCGATPIVTDIPALRRVVGDCGALTPVGDAAAMARALLAWSATDPVARRTRARTWFERSLSFDQIGVTLCDAYDTMLAGR